MADVTTDFWLWSSTASSNSPAGSTTIGAGLDDNLRAIQAAVRGAMEQATGVSGTNTITASMAGLTAYATGMLVRFIPANSNTGATTININSLGAKNIYLNAGALVGYELRKNCPVQLHYDGTQFNVIAGAHGGDGVALGTILPFSGSTAPNGYVLAYGQALNRTTYADYFALVSTTYGTGDGSTTFNAPDCRGRVIAGKDDMGGSAASRLTSTTITSGATTLGNSGGEQTHALTVGELAAHTHGPGGGNAFIDTNVGAGGSGFTSGSDAITRDSGTGSTGSGTAHNNVQPTIIGNYIIKV